MVGEANRRLGIPIVGFQENVWYKRKIVVTDDKMRLSGESLSPCPVTNTRTPHIMRNGLIL
jgi:hypothetical protein